LIILLGCATKYVKKVPEEEKLRARITQFWKHRMNREFDKMYDFEYPLYRKAVSMVNYIEGAPKHSRILDAEIADISIEGNQAKVGMNVKAWISLPQFRMNKGDSYTSYRRERWVKADGEWYHLPKKFQIGDKPGN
jgi:hypothetical protein